MPLYDAYGRPVKISDLNETLAAPTLSGIRSLWHDSVVSGMTPSRLAQVLRSASDGDPDAYLTLAEEMEERDLHYASVLGTRKRALSGLPLTVEAASDDAPDKKLADEIRTLCTSPALRQGIVGLLDALGKGFAVAEIMWHKGPRWEPAELLWRDPHFFMFERVGRTELRLRDERDLAAGIPLAPYKFITHVPNLKSGIPIRGGLARLVAWSYLFKNYTLKDWMGFIEVFGMPLRVGRYGPGTSEDDIDILRSAVANLGSDAAAVLPESMKIEFETVAQTAGGDRLFEAAGSWLDAQVSKAVLGQTMTSDSGSSRAQAEVHNDVRLDIQRSDALELEDTLNRDLVRPYIDLNFGPQSRYPRLCLPVLEPEDLVGLADSIAKLVPVGLQVSQQHVRDRLGLEDPKPDEPLLGAAPGNVESLSNVSDAPRSGNRAGHCQHCGVAHNAEGDTPEADLDEIESEYLADWEPQLEPIITGLRQLVERAQTYDELKAGLADLMAEFDDQDQRFIEQIAISAFIAQGMGDGGTDT